jgi:hypothetical protein
MWKLEAEVADKRKTPGFLPGDNRMYRCLNGLSFLRGKAGENPVNTTRTPEVTVDKASFVPEYGMGHILRDFKMIECWSCTSMGRL